MKGVVFNTVQAVVEERFGADVWDTAVERAGVDGSYTSLGSYPDSDLFALVAVLAELAQVGRSDVLVLAGRDGFRHLAERHLDLLDGLDGWRAVLTRLDGIIHPEVLKIYPEAEVPSFTATEHEGGIRLEYRSARRLCHLAEGLALGLGDWYDATLAVEHVSCVHRGDDSCVLEVAGA